MKKILFAIAALMVSTLSFAQGFGGGFGGGQGMSMNPEDMAKRQADRLKEQLELNQVQYDSIYNYYVANAKEQAARREQMQNGGGQPAQEDMQAMMEQMQKQRAAQEANALEQGDFSHFLALVNQQSCQSRRRRCQRRSVSSCWRHTGV